MNESEDGVGSTTADTSTRPRRSARIPAKTPTKVPTTLAPPSDSPTRGKRKARVASEKNPAGKLEYLLTNPKSKMTKVDISNVINYNTFLELSEASQARLCALLPPTAFSTYRSSVCSSHPDFRQETGSADLMDVDERDSAGSTAAAAQADCSQTPATFDPMFFTSPFFRSAARTFQDHLYSSWLAKKASDDLEKFLQGAQNGTLHAEWKDEVWERDHQEGTHATQRGKPVTLDLAVLAKRGLLKVGDVLAYRRQFPALGVVVEKDLLIDAANAHSHALTFLVSPGTQTPLDSSMLLSGPREYEGKVLSMEDIVDPVALERGVLDVDGRVGYADKYAHDAASCPGDASTTSGAPSEQLRNSIAVRAWKAFTVWRWSEDTQENIEMQMVQERGGREFVATLFYLRGCCTNQSGS